MNGSRQHCEVLASTVDGESAPSATGKHTWVNRGAAGLAMEMCIPGSRNAHSKVVALTGRQRWVFIAAASFIGRGPKAEADPQLLTSAANIAKRAGVSVRTVERVLPELCGLGVIEHTGHRITARDGQGWNAGPVIYRLTALAEAFRTRSATVAEQGPTRSATVAEQESTSSARLADEETATVADEETARLADNPLYPCDPKGATEEEDPAAVAAPSAGAAGTAARPGGASPSPETIAEIAAKEGASVEHTERWAENKLTGVPLRSTADAFLWGCVRRGDGPASWTAPAPRSSGSAAEGTPGSRSRKSKGKPSLAKPAGRKPSSASSTRKPRLTEAERNAATARIISGAATVHEIAEETGRSVVRVKQWIVELRQTMANVVTRERNPRSVEEVAEEFGLSPVAVLAVADERHPGWQVRKEEKAERERQAEEREQQQAEERERAERGLAPVVRPWEDPAVIAELRARREAAERQKPEPASAAVGRHPVRTWERAE
jgi:hypothetical protein